MLLLDLDKIDNIRPRTTPLPKLSIDRLIDQLAKLAID
jgi:hypothetical protein